MGGSTVFSLREFFLKDLYLNNCISLFLLFGWPHCKVASWVPWLNISICYFYSLTLQSKQL